MSKVTSLFLASFLLTGCNLTAQLTGGGSKHTYTETYTHQGNEYSFEVTFQLNGGKVESFTMEPLNMDASQRGELLALQANLLKYIRVTKPEDIVHWQRVGEEPQELSDAVWRAVEKLKQAVP